MREQKPRPEKCPRCGKNLDGVVVIGGVCRSCYYRMRREGESMKQYATGKTVSQAAKDQRLEGAEVCSATHVDDGYLTPVRVPIRYGDGGSSEEVGSKSYRDGMVYSGMIDSKERWWLDSLTPETARRMLALQERNLKKVQKNGGRADTNSKHRT